MLDQRKVRSITVIAAVGAAISLRTAADLELGTAVGVSTFGATVADMLVGWFRGGKLFVVLYRSGRFAFLIATCVLVAYAFWLVAVDPRGATRDEVLKFVVLTSALILTCTYAVGKFFSLRYTEARMSFVKDTVKQVHETLRRNDFENDQKKELCTKQILCALRNISELSVWHAAFHKLSVAFGGVFTASMYFKAEPQHQRFRLVSVEWDRLRADPNLDTVIQWMKSNHHPIFLKEKEWNDLVIKIKNEGRSGVRKRLLADSTRGDCISACGWTYERVNEALLSDDAKRCLAWDEGFLGEPIIKDYDRKLRRLLNVKSFVALRVPPTEANDGGVILVVKNRYNGFDEEQKEAMVLLSLLLARVLECDVGP